VAICHDGIVHKYVIMGVQGSGKGTQSALLAEQFDLVHIGVGDIFRFNVQHHTKLGARVRRAIDAGELVSDDLVESIVQQRLRDHDWNYGFIIDGFPRNASQAEFFLESFDIDAVINLELSDEEVHRRVLARRLCSGCGLDYNLMAHRPEVDDVCDVCGGRLVTRDDDNSEALAGRLADYYEKTRPVLDIFERKEFVMSIDASSSRDDVFADICGRLDLLAHQPIAAAFVAGEVGADTDDMTGSDPTEADRTGS
jgi:adenylate kinase